MPKLHTRDFPPPCNQKFAKITMLKFSINENLSFWSAQIFGCREEEITSAKFWHQLNRDKPTFNKSNDNHHVVIDSTIFLKHKKMSKLFLTPSKLLTSKPDESLIL